MAANPRTRPAPRRQPPWSFRQAWQHFLTPAAFKQARQARPTSDGRRWNTHALVGVLLTLTWCCGDSLGERFETARAFYVACHPKRKRPGKTIQGFHMALARLPAACLRAVAAGVRRRLAETLKDDLAVDGFVPLGCDGSRLECPRSAELEQRLGQSGKEQSAPMLWVTALVHLGSGALWAWRLGKGTADEKAHLRQLLPLLPAAALVVADAGYVSYELAGAIMGAGADFLIRMSSRAYLYTERDLPLERFRDGAVYYWPDWAQKKQLPPLRARLIRVPGRQIDVWLLTSVLDKKRLKVRTAAKFYRWRWKNEGLFRTYKRTLSKVKLACRTVRLVHREAEGSLLAVQVLLAQGVAALRRAECGTEARVSPRGALRVIRQEIAAGLGPRQFAAYERRLAAARIEERRRRSSKVRREWPRRVPHKPPKPPSLRTLTTKLKARMAKVLEAMKTV
jgi:Transposase DDE domain